MLYRNFGKTNEKVSILGYGCMRLPLLESGDASKIDEEKAIKLIRYAIDNGVNYIDTAYPYHNDGKNPAGYSEPFLAKVLKDGYREKVNVATKLPSWLIKSREDMDKYLNEQLERLGIDQIDFYLVHTLDRDKWKNLKNLGVREFLDSAIKDGRIKYAGFSFHDYIDIFKEIVDAYDWSFCQIQYNYIDENFQGGTEAIEYAYSKGLGITIMEPLRGGKLVNNLPNEVKDIFEKANDIHKITRTPQEWALRWIWNRKEVSCVLSGMNALEQIDENIKIASMSQSESFSDEEIKTVEKARDIYLQKVKVGCTGCGYCMPCPRGVVIPDIFSIYNDYFMFGENTMYSRLDSKEKASNCIKCGLCEKQCPQHIEIRKELENVKNLFEK
ncbi:MAG: aldo/keto reductase [Clostridioides sp.]|jgi:predicted aldo/keto reductase-like oxidoreductase|nr:aldo/keto reductase [Clostridioides sp.]